MLEAAQAKVETHSPFRIFCPVDGGGFGFLNCPEQVYPRSAILKERRGRIAEQEPNSKAYQCKRQKLLQRDNSRPRCKVVPLRRSRHLAMPSTRSPVSIRSIFTSSPTMIGKLHVSAAPCWLTSRTNVFRTSLTGRFKIQSHWDRDPFARAPTCLSD